MVIKRLETDEEIDGKANVHCHAWKETYAGLIDQTFLDNRTVELSRERAFRAFRNGISTLIAKDGDRVVGFADYGKYRWDEPRQRGCFHAHRSRDEDHQPRRP